MDLELFVLIVITLFGMVVLASLVFSIDAPYHVIQIGWVLRSPCRHR